MLGRLYNGICASLGAAASAQFPAFYTQYLQQLSGRLHQVRADLAPVVEDAERHGVSVASYLARAESEGGDLTARLVEGYRNAYETMERLEAAYRALRSADVFERPVVFAAHLRPEVAQATLQDFTPALPISVEGLGYAAAGVLIGIGLAWVSEQPIEFWRKRRRAKRKQSRQNDERSEGA